MRDKVEIEPKQGRKETCPSVLGAEATDWFLVDWQLGGGSSAIRVEAIAIRLVP